ncbi:serine/threonine-protein phosphatase 2A 65 kDa regulatory subunit A beta isoform-like [Helianthus annuus]|uniref:serine/threonine-protein phosphatase 2A 65 kDa regulatory subunit A beta isoform-like n=1 Tax=Helianthus annuus TaxID=4232 RepID=UPI00165302A4|nr:serine/threonine-protein phosphatase 2A 65 kDa regulatory subunit A beta isoform-like [Helianthus annuus]
MSYRTQTNTLAKVYSIRDAAENNLKRLSEEFGPDWAMQHIVPQVLDMIKNPHYLYRMTVLRAISLLAPVMGSVITCSKLLPVVVTASKDRVPNIKFNVAKVLQSLVLIVDPFLVFPYYVDVVILLEIETFDPFASEWVGLTIAFDRKQVGWFCRFEIQTARFSSFNGSVRSETWNQPYITEPFGMVQTSNRQTARQTEQFGYMVGLIWLNQQACFGLGDSVVEKSIKPCLVELAEDPDVDVRYLANQALQSIDQVMMSS